MDSEKIAGRLIEKLKARKEKITFAESCTAGLLAGCFCGVAGASEVFDGSIVSYANEVKNRFLGVKEETLLRVGAVSKECAGQMAEGACAKFGAELALSVTGIAGPGGGTPEKPVGTVYIGCSYRGKTIVEKHLFTGSRNEVRAMSVYAALALADEMTV